MPTFLQDTVDAAGAGGGSETRHLRDVLLRCSALASERPKAFFSAKHLEADLVKLVKVCVCVWGGGGIYMLWGF